MVVISWGYTRKFEEKTWTSVDQCKEVKNFWKFQGSHGKVDWNRGQLLTNRYSQHVRGGVGEVEVLLKVVSKSSFSR